MNRNNDPYAYGNHNVHVDDDEDEDEDEDWIPLSDTNDTSTAAAIGGDKEDDDDNNNNDDDRNHGTSQQDDVIPPHKYEHMNEHEHDYNFSNRNQIHVDSFHTFESHFGRPNSKEDTNYENATTGSTTTNTASSNSKSNTNNNNNNNNNNNDDKKKRLNDTMDTLRKKHERNRKIQESFTDRPLAMLPKIFLCHLMREFWNSHRFIRLGIIFILSGLCLQLSSFGVLFFFSLYKLPQLIISSIIIGVVSYLLFYNLDNPLYDFIQALSCKDQQQTEGKNDVHHFMVDIFFTCLEYINGVILRRICLCVFFIVPIIMEMKALLFLSSLVSDGVFDMTTTNATTTAITAMTTTTSFLIGFSICWLFVIVQLILFIPTHFQMTTKKPTSTSANATTSTKKWEHGTYSFGPVVLVLKSHLGSTPTSSSTSSSIPSSLFEIRIHSWAYLYILALIASTFMMSHDNFQIHKPIILGAPFLLVTGCLLILSCHEEDEDLFLNVVRRALERSLMDMVQFVGEDIAEDEMLQLNMIQWIVEYWATTTNSAASDSNDGNSGGNSGGGSNDLSSAFTGRPSSSANYPTSSSTTSSTSYQHPNVNINPDSNSNSNPNMAAPRPNNPSTNQRPRTKIGVELPSFINIDERARPAVLSYKKAVEEFPPSRNTCIILAMAKRCPAILSVSCLHLSGSLNAIYITIILSPMMILEIMRTSEWINACYRAMVIENLRDRRNDDDDIQIQEGIPMDKNDEKGSLGFLPEDMEPMEILLSIDSYSPYNRGSPLQVWMNVQSSVVALESSLTAMKCVNTANIATDVAFDVVSLAKLGLEVKDKGLPYGVSVLAKDLFQFHLEKSMRSNTSQSSQGTEPQYDGQQGSYSKAAINLVNNGQMLSKNIVELIEDGKKEDNILHPVVSGISTVFGKGWLWGKEEEEEENDNRSNSSSTPRDDNDQKGDDTSTCQSNHEKSQNDEISSALSDDFDRRKQIPIDQDQERNVDSQFIDMEYDTELEINQSRSDSAQIREDNTEMENKLKNQLEPESATKEVSAVISDSNKDEKQIISPTGRQNQAVIQDSENEKNGLNLFGAGLAVIAGAVVGGIALVAKGGEDERRRKRENTNSRSTVTIERLDDEE